LPVRPGLVDQGRDRGERSFAVDVTRSRHSAPRDDGACVIDQTGLDLRPSDVDCEGEVHRSQRRLRRMPRQQTAEPSGALAGAFASVVDNVERAIQSKSEVIQLALMCLLSEGHLLIEDVPGVGKTSLAKAMAASVQCSFGRV